MTAQYHTVCTCVCRCQCVGKGRAGVEKVMQDLIFRIFFHMEKLGSAMRRENMMKTPLFFCS